MSKIFMTIAIALSVFNVTNAVAQENRVSFFSPLHVATDTIEVVIENANNVANQIV